MTTKDYILTSITANRKELSRAGIRVAGLYGTLKRTTIFSHAIKQQ